MTHEHALAFIAGHPTARNYVKASHLDDLSSLLAVHIEAITCRKDQFHLLNGSTYMPKKETIDAFASAAGVSFAAAAESTRREGEDCYIGRSQAIVLGADGSYILGDACEYEFDAKIRHEEELIADRQSSSPRMHANGTLIDAKARLAYLALRKVARQRANTGARCRATLSILGMQTGFKDLFARDARPETSVTFLFSRIIINARNERVTKHLLDRIDRPTMLLYGQQASPPLTPPDEPEPEDTNRLDRSGIAIQTIHEYLAAGTIGPRAIAMAKGALERGEKDPRVLEEIVVTLKAIHERSLSRRSGKDEGIEASKRQERAA